MTIIMSAYTYSGKLYPVHLRSPGDIYEKKALISSHLGSIKDIIEKDGFTKTIMDLHNAISKKYHIPHYGIRVAHIAYLQSIGVPVDQRDSSVNIEHKLYQVHRFKNFAQQLLSPYLVSVAQYNVDLIISLDIDHHKLNVYTADPSASFQMIPVIEFWRRIYYLITSINMQDFKRCRSLYEKYEDDRNRILNETGE